MYIQMSWAFCLLKLGMGNAEILLLRLLQLRCIVCIESCQPLM